MKSKFDLAYSSLNPQQKLAVDTLEGPVMVIAGPGTGKTQVLTTRIANLLNKTDTSPDSILALTFTESGAKAMSNRLFELIGPISYRVHISTFHSFCQQLINTYPDYFIIGNNPRPINDIERLQLLKSILHSQSFDYLKPLNAPDLYIPALITAIQNLKRENVDPKKLSHLLKKQLADLIANQQQLSNSQFTTQEKNLAKNLELVTVYKKYQQNLHLTSRYDYEDMINFCINKFSSDPNFLSIIQEKYQYFLVDEYQDTNNAQNQLLQLLCSYFADNPNLFVVLDDEQSIFRFQGASLENALNFLSFYPKVQVINLTQNYRSQQNILDVARTLIENNTHNLQHRLPQLNRDLQSQVDYPLSKIKVLSFANPNAENIFIVDQIKKLITAGTSPDQIAVIVRNNADLQPLAALFAQNNLPFTSSSPGQLLDSLPIKYLIRLLQTIENSRLSLDDLDLFTVLNFPFFHYDQLEILKLCRSAALQRTPLFNTLIKQSAFPHFSSLLLDWHNQSTNLTFSEFVQNVIKQSGLLDYVLSHPQVAQFLPDLNAFFDFVKEQNQINHDLSLPTFLKIIELVIQNHLPLTSTIYNLSSASVTLTTAHKAKGLEWQYCFITQCLDGHWGNQLTRQLISLPNNILKQDLQAHPLEDERRLFYVALTRAKKHIFITYSQMTSQNRPVMPSLFLQELPTEKLQNLQPKISPSQLKKSAIDRLTPTALSSSETELLSSILTDFKLSVTALNTYLTCAYKFKLNDLYKVPKVKQPYLSFGTAVHAALQKFHQRLVVSHPGGGKVQQSETLDSRGVNLERVASLKKYLLKQFKLALQNETMTEHDFKARLEHGLKVLNDYFDFFVQDFQSPLSTEKKFGSSTHPILLDDIYLTGKIDRLDQIADGVRVVDYKTGKRKTRGQIEGTTQDSNGDQKRQLVFYQLLMDLSYSQEKNTGSGRTPSPGVNLGTGNYKMVEAQLDFIETPHQEKKSGRENFKITKQEVDELKSIIKQSMQQIRSLNFPRTTDYRNCQNCDFLQHCWPNGLPLD